MFIQNKTSKHYKNEEENEQLDKQYCAIAQFPFTTCSGNNDKKLDLNKR